VQVRQTVCHNFGEGFFSFFIETLGRFWFNSEKSFNTILWVTSKATRKGDGSDK
jgi:hypothetical protein